jgi:ankyrin repeat protein
MINTDYSSLHLHWAIVTKDHDRLEKSIASGASLNGVNRAGMTPLALAIDAGQDLMALKILAAGADPNIAQNPTETPLLLAFKKPGMLRHQELCSALAQAGAQLHVHNEEGQSPLHLAILWKFDKLVACFLQHGADPNQPTRHVAPGSFAQSPLSLVRQSYGPDDLQRRKRLQLMLLAHGASKWSPELTGDLRVDPLQAAAMAGLTNQAVALIERGESWKTRGPQKSPIQLAREAGHLETADAMEVACANRAMKTILDIANEPFKAFP